MSIKMKNCKNIYKAHTANRHKEIIQRPSPPPTPSPDKKIKYYYVSGLWKKVFLTEIYRNMQTFTFKVLQNAVLGL